MGRKCSVKDCRSDTQRREDLGVTFHKIPTHSDIRPKWLELCKVDEDKKVIFVCSRHFVRADFCNFKGTKYVLRQGVLPSIFPWKKIPIEKVIKEEEEEAAKKPAGKVRQRTPSKEKSLKMATNKSVEENLNPPPLVKLEDIKEEVVNPPVPATVEQKIKAVNPMITPLTFTVNARIEALDFNQVWMPATILEVDYEENEVLVHFDKYSSKYDEWIGIHSNSIRAMQPESVTPVATVMPVPAVAPIGPEKLVEVPIKVEEKIEVQPELEKSVYVLGERCMAIWTEFDWYPATVSKVIDKDTYQVLYDDGYSKVLKADKMSKCTNDSLITPMQPIRSTKEDRRNKKRKINVSTLFGKKRSRVNHDNKGSPSTARDSPSGDPNFVADGDIWVPSWTDGRPNGVDSSLLFNEGYRRTVIVPDPLLPPHWQKHLSQRPYGTAMGKWDAMIISPDGRKFRIKSEIKQYIEDNPHLGYHEDNFNFALVKRSRPKPKPKALPPLPRTPPPPPKPKHNLEALQIVEVNGGFKCCIDNCGKNFRRENLAMMHVKHYHPQFRQFLDSMPNVADLAYARTVGENLDRSPVPEKPTPIRQRPRTSTPKAIKQEVEMPLIGNCSPTIEQQKDAEIIKLLNSKPFDSIKSVDASTTEPLPSGLPASMYPDIKLKDLLVKSECVPKGHELSTKVLTSAPPRTGLKTLFPVKKHEDSAGKLMAKNSKKKKADGVDSPIGFLDAATPPLMETIKTEPKSDNNDIIIEGGEVIKIVRMKQEEIINCTCGITEEDGLMIQCELCLCWQHAYCNNIQRENEVPEKYVCYICQHPVRQRNSKKFFHDQDWLKHGNLPTGSYHCRDEELNSKRFEKLKVSHDLGGGLLELKDFMHSLRLKIKVAEAKNHPKLYLWSKPWEKLGLPEKQEIKQEPKDELIKSEDEPSDSMLFSLFKSGKDGDIKVKDELPELPKIDINSLIENNLDALAPIIPQPEAAIESSDCRIHLLEHIAHCQSLVEERLSNFEKQINELDSTLINDNDENYARMRHTTSMLLQDLDTLNELSQVTTF